MPPQKTTPRPHDQALCLIAASVKRTLSKINTRKAAGPDNIPGRVLKDWAGELKDVFMDIFNASLSQAVVPSCFKDTTIIPVPKKPSPSTFNDYRPVALTPIIMKCFERLLMGHIKSPVCIPRMLFIDFSSAFNTIIPQQLICKLDQLGLSTFLCNWLLDFLSERPQAVRQQPLVKFADDTTVVGLISNNDETHYRKEVSQFVTWCRDNNLFLNINKTKEVVIDFRRGHTHKPPLTINGAAVERVSSTKFLGVNISEDLSWTMNTASLAKKGHRRLYFLHKLKRARAPQPIKCSFYGAPSRAS
ncbi:hypothetical protein F2P81_023409 [Scophthalmus maximus]|uniref:Alkylated DNA repair protein AlkB homologue 8 N-terminal domain-containing protein n=1 Tax=Scophthalmus maximus TaxID=52904 RepID=A0A6A4RW46_SCOMX|nr:hypothetical protein F2P81_023409 [Scophthalmus maximus]